MMNIHTMAAMAAAVVALGAHAAEYKWYDGTNVTLEGHAFVDAPRYSRIPARYKGILPNVDMGLGRDSTGLAFRFISDAHYLAFRWKPRSPNAAMQHMPSTGVSGVDLYARTGTGAWRTVRCLRSTKPECFETIEWTPGDECLVYLPPYNGIHSFEIGVGRNCDSILPPPPHTFAEKPIVIYGHSITQGGCASRPGMIWTALASRHLDVEIANLGFSGSGHMELEWAQALATTDASLYVIDTLDNLSPKMVAERVEPFLRSLHSAKPDVPILVMENTDVHRLKKTGPICQGFKAIIDRLKAEDPAKWKNLHWLSREEQIPDDECTVDNCHLNDWGMINVARGFEACVRRIFGK